MTCIAWDGEILAADGRSTSDGIIISDKSTKLFKINVPYLDDMLLYIGFAGNVADKHKFLTYLQEEDFYKRDISHDLHALVIGKKFIYRLETNCSFLARYPKIKMAIGSGRDFAKSGMELGLNAIEAVKHAAKLDAFTGGKIHHFKCDR